MRKEEFLQVLRRALTGSVPPGTLQETIRYYDEYIAQEVQKGRAQEEVIEEIGDPRLIARTIEDTTDGAGAGGYESGGGYDYGQGADGGSGGGEYARSPFGTGRPSGWFRRDKWYGRLLTVLVALTVFYVAFSIISGVFTLLRPFMGPLLVVWIILTMFRNGKK